MKQYRLMVVDDEKITRDWLRQMVDWEALGFALCAECENGEEALQQLQTERYDLLLTDIKMPVCDGLELIRRARADGFEGKIIFISGFDEFEFAKFAIRHDVADYLLKPIETQELQRAVSRVYQALSSQNKASHSTGDIRYHYYAGKRALEDLLYSKSPTPAQLASFDEALDGRQYTVMRISFDKAAGAPPLSLFDCGEVIAASFEALRNECLFYETIFKNGILVCYPFALDDRLAFLQKLQTLLSAGGGSVSVAAGAAHKRAEELPQAIAETDDIDTCKFYRGRATVFWYEMDRFTPGKPFEPSSELLGLEQQLYARITEGDLAGTDAVIRKLRTCLAATKYCAPDQILAHYTTLLDAVVGQFVWAEFIEEAHSMRVKKFREQIEGAQFLEEAHSLFLQTVNYILSLFSSIKASTGFNLDKTLQYIQSNLAAVSLSSVAEYCNVTPKYFSRLFRENMQTKFIDYVTQKRIQEAMRLLRGSKRSVAEIGMQVGMQDQKYFSKYFKRATGLSPTQFRNSTNHQGHT